MTDQLDALAAPRTLVGQRFDHAWPGTNIDRLAWHNLILAIEAEARAVALRERDALREAALDALVFIENCIDGEDDDDKALIADLVANLRAALLDPEAEQ